MKKLFLKTKNYKTAYRTGPAPSGVWAGRLKTKKGFTILETMVAVFILTLSITGPMVFSQQSLRAAFLARDQITAFYLAQDIIETIKNMRDTNALQNRDWLYNLNTIEGCNSDSDEPCVILIDTTESDIDELKAVKCSGDECPVMKTDNYGRFVYDTSHNYPDSRFTRTTYLQETVNNQEAKIIVEVEWVSNVRIGNTRILVQENIYNWVPRN